MYTRNRYIKVRVQLCLIPPRPSLPLVFNMHYRLKGRRPGRVHEVMISGGQRVGGLPDEESLALPCKMANQGVRASREYQYSFLFCTLVTDQRKVCELK